VRVLLYEWACAGGGETAGAAPAAAITAEGRAMLAALVRDAARDPTLEITLLVAAADAAAIRAAAGLGDPGRYVRVCLVPPGTETDVLHAEAARAEWTVVVAPETDGLLANRVRAARAAGGRVAGCGDGFIAVAGDKQATATALAAAGVPVPAGRPLVAGEPLPEGFHLPAVRKPRDGCGGDGLVVIRGRDGVAPAASPQRLEAFAAGLPVGVSCLCGPAGVVGLCPIVQRFSTGDRPRYLGGESAANARWRARAVGLAERAVRAVARAAGDAAAGWVGVDMVLGAADDGRDDRVLEVNPRLTTSFVGLAAIAAESLLSRLLEAAAGEVPRPRNVPGRSVVFAAAGGVEVHDGGPDGATDA
jgi:tyramine---L-glutamate ligase